jgi:ABC-type Co2+ transport system, permease component
MHIPDGYLDPIWCAGTYAVTIAYLIYAYRRVRANYDVSRAIPLMTVFAAGIFVAQMLNWPIPGGTSLHFVGGALSAIVLGPYLASYVMFLVLLVQALVFHDGGITTLGANVLNMGIIDVWVGYLIYRLVTRYVGGSRGIFLGAFLGGWAGITIAGAAAGTEIGLSPWFPYGIYVSLPVMASWHALLGIVEGAITAFVAQYLLTKHPELTQVVKVGVRAS